MHFILVCYCIKQFIKLLFLIQKIWYLADLCLDSMCFELCRHIYNFEFVYENIDIVLLNDHIWNYCNLNGYISQTQLDILFKFSEFSTFTS